MKTIYSLANQLFNSRRRETLVFWMNYKRRKNNRFDWDFNDTFFLGLRLGIKDGRKEAAASIGRRRLIFVAATKHRRRFATGKTSSLTIDICQYVLSFIFLWHGKVAPQPTGRIHFFSSLSLSLSSNTGARTLSSYFCVSPNRLLLIDRLLSKRV